VTLVQQANLGIETQEVPLAISEGALYYEGLSGYGRMIGNESGIGTTKNNFAKASDPQ
jgi:hypothetical protein